LRLFSVLPVRKLEFTLGATAPVDQLPRGGRMPFSPAQHHDRHLTSALIDLIIKLPDHEQEALLRALQARQAGPLEADAPKSASERSGEYAADRYFYWDLFSA
jgi:hypothetical protein